MPPGGWKCSSAADNNAIPDCAFDYLSGLCENHTAPALANGSFPVVACCELCIERKLEHYGEAYEHYTHMECVPRAPAAQSLTRGVGWHTSPYSQ